VEKDGEVSGAETVGHHFELFGRFSQSKFVAKATRSDLTDSDRFSSLETDPGVLVLPVTVSTVPL
jgi:hypothetical protein